MNRCSSNTYTRHTALWAVFQLLGSKLRGILSRKTGQKPSSETILVNSARLRTLNHCPGCNHQIRTTSEKDALATNTFFFFSQDLNEARSQVARAPKVKNSCESRRLTGTKRIHCAGKESSCGEPRRVCSGVNLQLNHPVILP